MRLFRKKNEGPRRLPVEWRDEEWSPGLVHLPGLARRATDAFRLWRGRNVGSLFQWRDPNPVKVEPPPMSPPSGRVRFAFLPSFQHHPPHVPILDQHKIMQSSGQKLYRRRHGFTLIELLVVIAIIGILAALLLPVLGGMKTRAKIGQARSEMSNLRAAIASYEADYHRFPASKTTEDAVAALGGNGDFTFQSPAPPPPPVVANSEVMEILLNLDQGSNQDYVRNPRKTVYFQAKPSSGAGGPGLGTDAILRDPWGSPYVISVDMNGDDKVFDAVYKKIGGKGLIQANPGGDYYLNGDIMIWSEGPDGDADATLPNATSNKDNIRSWD